MHCWTLLHGRIHGHRLSGQHVGLAGKAAAAAAAVEAVEDLVPVKAVTDLVAGEVVTHLVAGLQVGTWVLVQYGDSKYPGEVKQVRGLEYCVNVMHPSGSGYRWPYGQKDEIYYHESDIVKTLAAPVPSRSRGTFSFNI